MKAVWKFPLDVGLSEVEMPEGARLLSVQAQNDTPCLWALVDEDAGRETRRFLVRGTGHPINGDEGEYVGTFQLLDGTFIGHLFEVKS